MHGWIMERDERDAWMHHGPRREGFMDGSWTETRGMHGWIMDRDERDAWMDHGERRALGMHGWIMEREERDAWMDHGEGREGCIDGAWAKTRGIHG